MQILQIQVRARIIDIRKGVKKMIAKQDVLEMLQQHDAKNLSANKLPYFLTGLLGILVLIVGLQAVQLRSLTQAIESGAVVARAQGASSVLNNLKSQVGGCGG